MVVLIARANLLGLLLIFSVLPLGYLWIYSYFLLACPPLSYFCLILTICLVLSDLFRKYGFEYKFRSLN